MGIYTMTKSMRKVDT